MKRGRRGQFYLIAAIVVVAIVSGLIITTKTIKKESSTKVYDLKSQLETEYEEVLDYCLLNGLNPASIIYNFTEDFSDYAGEEVEIYYLTGKRGNLDAYRFNPGKIPVTFTENETEAEININELQYRFNITEGENFYFIITQEDGGEYYVAKN